jgi:hypothetical protein
LSKDLGLLSYLYRRCGDWRLIHRAEDDMLRLCDKAGIPADAERFHREPPGGNIFLRVRKR